MVIIYYVDLIFLWNCIVDALFLIVIHPKQKIKYVRIVVAAGFGAGCAVLLLYLWEEIGRIHMVLRFVCAGIMTLIGIPTRAVGELLCNIGLLYGMSGCLYGINMMLQGGINRFDNRNNILQLSSVLIVLLMRYLYQFRIKRNLADSYHYRVTLLYNQKKLKLRAFYDSGNHLFDPISGKAVILVSNKVMQKLNPDRNRFRLIPYSALGKQTGMLTAYRLDQVIVYEKEEKVYRDIYAASADNKMFAQECCDVILHSQQIG